MTDFPSHDLISAYVDDRLSPEERAEVEALLQSSAEARTELEGYRRLRKTLKALPTEPAPADLLARVMTQAEQESLHGKTLATVAVAQDERGSFRKRWTVPAVSVVTTLGLALLVMIQFNSPQAFVDNTATPEAASDREEAAASEFLADATEMDRSATADEAVAMDDIGEMERNLLRSDQFQFARPGNSDGTIMLSDFDLRTADVGDVVDALQMKGDGVAVVKLTVLDRQRFLNNLHVLLSDLNVPEEVRGVNTYDEGQNDYYAVYVEAGEGRFKELMANLQEDMNIAQMYVSTTIPSADLNPYVAEQGYSDLWGMNRAYNERGQNADPRAASAVGEAVAENQVKEGERKRFARPFDEESKEMPFAGQADEKPLALKGSKPESEFPPPPPLPFSRNIQPAEPQLAQRESGSIDAPAQMELAEALPPDNKSRQLMLRIPESVGKELTTRQQPATQRAVSNLKTADRQPVKRDVGALRGQRPELPAPPSSAGSSAVAKSPPILSDAPLPEPAAESKTEADDLSEQPTSPSVDGVQLKEIVEDKSLTRERKRDIRPMQVLFLLSADRASVTKPVPAAPPEAKQAPQK